MVLLRSLLTIILLAISISSFAKRLADDIEPGDGVNDIQLPLTKESAAELIKMETKGKILSVEKTPYKESFIFKIKVLHDNGKIKVYRLDPFTAHQPS
ncbi:hypothetical protein LCGC14_0440810 [marine sediment metagenome]|uniref:PepSY domain-containing protein n=1 Tax=marine sediment metagenome TaxID=412755 RepID=A0A0F9SRC2_9ZZZZ